jgi:uncharacterized protein with HEPN domain
MKWSATLPFNMNQRDRIRIRRMLDACREAISFIQGKSFPDVAADRILLLAVIKEIEIVGEAASRISAECSTLPSIRWTDIIGIRNRLIHAYFDIDAAVIWSTVNLDLPALAKQLEEALPERERSRFISYSALTAASISLAPAP